MRHVVIITFVEGTETDTDVYGPFESGTDARRWVEKFEAWWETLPSRRSPNRRSRTIRSIMLTRMSDYRWLTTLV